MNYVRPIIIFLVLVTLAALLMRWHFRDQVSHRYRSEALKVTVLRVSSANITMVEHGDTVLMIDSGNPGDGRRIEALLKQEAYDPSKIDYLVLTHGHLHHAGTAHYFQSKYGVKILGHRGDEAMFSRGECGETCPTGTLARLRKNFKKDLRIEPLMVDILIEDNFDLQDLGIPGEIIPTPGHTKGSLLIKIEDFLFVGDLIAGQVFSPHKPMTHFYMCDLEQNVLCEGHQYR